MTDQAAPAQAPIDRWFVPIILLCPALITFNSTAGVFVVPSVAKDFGVQLDAAQWVATASLVMGAVASPILIRMGNDDRRRPFMVGILVALVMLSAACALAPSFPLLIAARAAQGVAAALLPMSVAEARSALPPSRAPRVAAQINTAGTVTAGFVYVISGSLIEWFSYRDVFWFEAAFAALTLLLLTRLPRSGRPARHPRLDIRGLVLLTVGLVSLLPGISLGPHLGWTSVGVVFLLLVGTICLVACGVVDWHVKAPLIHFRLLKIQEVLGSVLISFLLGITLYVGISLNSRFLQQPIDGKTQSLFIIGLTLFPISIGSYAGMKLRPHIVRHLALYIVVMIGSLMYGATLLWLSIDRTSPLELGGSMFLIGVAGSLTFSVSYGILVEDVQPHETADASSINHVLFLIGRAIGSTLSVAILTALTPHADQIHATSRAYSFAYLSGVIFAVIAAGVAIATLRNVKPLSVPVTPPSDPQPPI